MRVLIFLLQVISFTTSIFYELLLAAYSLQHLPGAPFSLYKLISISGWISNHMPIKVWDEIASPFPNYHWSLGMNKQFHPPLHNGCNHLSMLELKLNNVKWRGPRQSHLNEFLWNTSKHFTLYHGTIIWKLHCFNTNLINWIENMMLCLRYMCIGISGLGCILD